MGKQTQTQIMLEEYQDRPNLVLRIEAEPDTTIDDSSVDMGSLPGCIGYYKKPEPGFVCSSCYHQQLCKTTTSHANSDGKKNKN